MLHARGSWIPLSLLLLPHNLVELLLDLWCFAHVPVAKHAAFKVPLLQRRLVFIHTVPY